jgi:hypothetical protein
MAVVSFIALEVGLLGEDSRLRIRAVDHAKNHSPRSYTPGSLRVVRSMA